MTISSPKADLRQYLQRARDAMVWKLDGLSSYDVRRPLTPTGTNLLGLVKHLSQCEFGYFGVTFGRPHEASEGRSWDTWALPSESQEYIVDQYKQSWAHADATIEALPLDTHGQVPWWGKNGEVTLHQILTHMIAESQRHAGHADIVRELIDGATGMLPTNSNMWKRDWAEHRDLLEQYAKQA